MYEPVFDLEGFEPLFKVTENMAVDAKGNFVMRLGDNLAMDMDSGRMRFTTPWQADDPSGEE